MAAEAIQKKVTPKYQYILAFVLGMVIMVVIYVLFDMSTNSEYRTRTATSSGSTSGLQLTKGTSSSITQTAGDTTDTTAPKVYLGVEVMDLNDIMAEQLGIQNSKGVLINAVIPKSPAALAGLKRGDVITFMNNRAVRDLEGFKKVLSSVEPGDKVRLVYVRNKEKASAYAIVIAPPSATTVAASSSSATQEWGVTLSPLSTALRTSLNVPDSISGVVIMEVLPGGLADRAGLKSGDIITAIDKTAIKNMDDFFKAIDQDTNNTALLSIYSQGTLRYVPLSDAIIKIADQVQTQSKLTLTAGPSSSSADTTTATATTDTTTSTGSSPATAGTSANRPSSVPPPQAGGPVSDTVLFIGLLVVLILYLSYREFHRPSDASSSEKDD